MPGREVVVINLFPGYCFRLDSPEWQPYVVSGVPEFQRLLKKKTFLVGIIAFDAETPHLRNRLDEIAVQSPSTEWLALIPANALASQEVCVAISCYFLDYHTIPFEADRLIVMLGHAFGKARILSNFDSNNPVPMRDLIGESDQMQQLYRIIEKVRKVDTPVLITGESGTGKEMVAKAVHACSRRKSGPFVAVNCGSLPGSLIQAELFGHERGAFTGAMSKRRGRIEAADGGVLFLDEIGDLSLDLQVNLLRFLQEKTIDPLGGTRSMAVDVRVVAATNIDIEEAVADGKFREDLYYRLNVLRIDMPPLRERGTDVELLAHAFLREYGRENPRVRGFTSGAIQAMLRHNWPGNVRELLNRVQRAIAMSDRKLLTPYDLGLENVPHRKNRITLGDARAEAEFNTILHSLIHNGYNVSQTAKQLGISRVTLYRLINKLDIPVREEADGTLVGS